MILILRLLIAVVLFETAVAGILLARRALRQEAQVPAVVLHDPLVMPQLKELARAADRGDSDDQTRFGMALLGKGFYGHAEWAFRDALRSNAQNADAQFGLAFSLDRLGRMAESSSEYRKVTQLNPRSENQKLNQVHALHAIGRNALRQENLVGAEESFKVNSGFSPADYLLAQLLLRSDRAEQAAPIIRRKLAELPRSLEFHFLDHRLQLALGRPRAAFEAAAMMERSDYVVSLNFYTEYVMPLERMTGLSTLISPLGEVAGTDDLDRIEELAKQVKAAQGDTPVFMAKIVDDQLLDVAVRGKRPERVLELLAELRVEGRENAGMLEAEGDAWEMLEQPERAAEHWQRALLLTPSVGLHEKLARHFDSHQPDPERRDRHLAQAKLLQGIEDYRGDRLATAIENLEAATRFNPRDPNPWFYLGEIRFHRRQPELALAAYERCLEIRPGHGPAEAKRRHLTEPSGP
ncbi:MAG: hypothetical protein EA381_06590 [Planctomycetaceae bacterium]|nr:MAG: hypothetical protein EA381_06590 [Planctomycetaceae bacterium]